MKHGDVNSGILFSPVFLSHRPVVPFLCYPDAAAAVLINNIVTEVYILAVSCN
jgi:hypothetical protein